MEYRNFLGATPSLLGYGCMRFPVKDDHIDVPAAEELVDYAYRHGVNYFDTAYRYHGGESETFIGQALSKYPRDSFYLATKLPNWMLEKPEDIARIFEDQLARCQVEYFDFYLIHALSKPSWDRMEQLGVYDALLKYKQEGKIRRLGFSFHDKPEVLEEICSAHPFDFVQIQCNYFDWDYQDAKTQYEIVERHGMGCIIMEPVRGGMLAKLDPDSCEILRQAEPNRSIASWAIRFAASLPNVITVLSGMTEMEQVKDNLATMDPFQPLNDSERAVLDHALQVFKEKKTIPCTKCRYCVEQCPQSIQIPEIIASMNALAFSGDRNGFKDFLSKLENKPSACISCGACEDICPQHIEIPTRVMAEAAKCEA